jgi:N-acetyl-anhydromuramyl-L-alanine amidase AmpD
MLAFIRRIFSPKHPEKPMLPKYPEKRKQTLNVSARRIRPTHILVHHTDGAYAGSVAWCCDPKSMVSYHCIVARDGRRTVLADPEQRAWHAGKSEWQGRKDCNSFMVGIAWEGNTETTPLTQSAIESACEYLLPIIAEYQIPIWNIVRHADVAPGRKTDCSKLALAQLQTALKIYG